MVDLVVVKEFCDRTKDCTRCALYEKEEQKCALSGSPKDWKDIKRIWDGYVEMTMDWTGERFD